MKNNKRLLSMLIVSAWVLPIVAQAPPRMESLDFPEGVDPDEFVPTDDPVQRDHISKMIEKGQSAVSEGSVPVDIYEIMAAGGSVLEGKLLDEPIRIPQHLRSHDSTAIQKPTTVEQRVRIAELLLKTSRLLDNLNGASENQRLLVGRMRREAVGLLSQASLQASPQASSDQTSTLTPAGESPDASSRLPGCVRVGGDGAMPAQDSSQPDLPPETRER